MKSSNYSPCGVSQTFIKFLKTHTGLVISKHISDLFNRIFSTGCFPQCWKVAHLTPIFKKKGSKSEIENYRPISILPTLSKLCEMVIHPTFDTFSVQFNNFQSASSIFAWRLNNPAINFTNSQHQNNHVIQKHCPCSVFGCQQSL